MTQGQGAPVRTVGESIRRFREEAGLSLGQLAERAEVSKSYLWNLENRTEDKRPSAKVLFGIASALGVTLADLYGHGLAMEKQSPIEPSLAEFAKAAHLNAADVRMLASIAWRGEPPRTVDRWQFIYNAIRSSRSLDEEA